MSINENIESEVILLIADISGYTNFMHANKRTATRSHQVIIELIQSIILYSGMPLTLAKIEGDALFLYAMKSESEEEWFSVRKKVGETAVNFFQIFRDKIHELSNSILCEENSCINIDQLGLKVIIHCGLAHRYSINNMVELAGLDVILIHRLLKNSVKQKEYVLMTESACNEIMFPKIICVDSCCENYAEFGDVKTYIFYITDKRDEARKN